MGEARRRRLAGDHARPEVRGLLERYVEDLRAENRVAERQLREDVRRPGRKLVSAELVPIAEALADPGLGPGTLEAILATFAAAHDVGEGGLMCECATCRALWTPGRVPKTALVIRILEPEAVQLAFLCEACACAPPPELRRRVLAMLRHDYLGGEGEEVTLAPEGGTA